MSAAVVVAGFDRFPVGEFKRLIRLTQDYPTPRAFGSVGVGESFFGIPWAAIERARLASIVTCVTHVFIVDRARHHFTRTHLPVWVAMECGIILLPGQAWRYAFPEQPRMVMDDRETARLFDISEATARTYRDAAVRALDNEWFWLNTRES